MWYADVLRGSWGREGISGKMSMIADLGNAVASQNASTFSFIAPKALCHR